jgi:hypothetical protein
MKDDGCAPVDPVAGYFSRALLAVTGAVCYFQPETRQLRGRSSRNTDIDSVLETLDSWCPFNYRLWVKPA